LGFINRPYSPLKLHFTPFCVFDFLKVCELDIIFNFHKVPPPFPLPMLSHHIPFFCLRGSLTKHSHFRRYVGASALPAATLRLKFVIIDQTLPRN
jgi:hypothetical protein